MADISSFTRLVAGVLRSVDISSNTLVVTSIKIGGVTNTELTKAILDNLVSLQDGSDVSASLHHHDGRYFTESELGSSAASSGSDLVGDDNTYSNFTPSAATVKGALAGIDAALASAGSDENVKISANDTTAGYVEDKFVVDNGTNSTNPLEASTLNDGGNEDYRIRFDQSKVDHGSIAGLADDDHTQYHNDTRGDARYYQKTEFTTSSTADAPVKLDGSGKIALAQLPSAIMTYEGTWNASTNTPTLADSVGDVGMVYRVSVAGTQDLGSGNISFEVGDYAILNSSLVWEKSDTTDAVASVNGQTGVVVLDTDDISEGTNVYFTDERAQDAVGAMVANTATVDLTYTDGTPELKADVKANSISETHLTASVAGNGLAGGNGTALSVNVDNSTIEINTDSLRVKAAGINENHISSSALLGGLVGGSGSPLTVAYAPAMEIQLPVGESVAADTTFAVRFAVDGETAGRVYKATNDATSNNLFFVVGFVQSASALSAGDDTSVKISGVLELAGNDTAFNAADIGKPVYLTTAGGFSVTPPSASNSAIYVVGIVRDTSSIFIGNKQLMGINA